MKWPRTSTRPEIPRCAAARQNPRTIPRSIGQITPSESLGQAFGSTGDIERRPVECVDCGLVGGIFDVVKNHGIRVLNLSRRGTWIGTQVPVELKPGRLVPTAAGICHGNFSAVLPRGRSDPQHPGGAGLRARAGGACAFISAADDMRTIAENRTSLHYLRLTVLLGKDLPLSSPELPILYFIRYSVEVEGDKSDDEPERSVDARSCICGTVV